MIEIKDLLGKFDSLLATSGLKKDTIRTVISQVIRTEIKSEDISIDKNGTVHLNIKPIYKNEILMKRDQIDRLLEEMLGKRAPQELR